MYIGKVHIRKVHLVMLTSYKYHQDYYNYYKWGKLHNNDDKMTFNNTQKMRNDWK